MKPLCHAALCYFILAAVLQAYNSMKPLAAWTRDLICRMDQLAQWAATSHPPTIFWMSGFTFPTGFLTAVLQTYARANNVRTPQCCLCSASSDSDSCSVCSVRVKSGALLKLSEFATLVFCPSWLIVNCQNLPLTRLIVNCQNLLLFSFFVLVGL